MINLVSANTNNTDCPLGFYMTGLGFCCPKGYSVTSSTDGHSITYDCKKTGNNGVISPLIQNNQSVDSVIFTNSKEIKSINEKSAAEKDCIYNKKECWDGNFCYPLGYIKGEKYCSEKAIIIASSIYHPGFINQSRTGASCVQGYECKTGVCSNNFCINLTEQQNQIKILNASLTSLSQANSNVDQNLGKSKNTSEEIKEGTEKNQGSIQKIAVFLKNLFAFSK